MSLSQNLLFVRGFWKSGTNWLSSLLELHPQIAVSGEYHWEYLLEGLDRQAESGAIHTQGEAMIDTKEGLWQYIRSVMVELEKRRARDEKRDFSDLEWIGDRTPTPLLPLTVENAPYFYIIRDGRDCLVSAFYHILNHPSAEWIAAPEYKTKLEKFSQDSFYFVRNPHELLEWEEFVRSQAKNWKTSMHNIWAAQQMKESGNLKARLYTLQYEDLHHNVETRRREMYEFLGLEPERAAGLDHRTSPGFSEENPESFNRKGVVGDWQLYFTDKQLSWYLEEAGEELRKLGYSQNSQNE